MIDRDPFLAFQSIGAILAYVHSKLGTEATERLLSECDFRRETLRREASVLKQLGLTDLASVVECRARKAKPTPVEELPFRERVAARRGRRR